MADRFSLITLGTPALLKNEAVARLARKKSLILLIYLAISGRWYGREKLAALFWPDSQAEKARMALRSALSDLNKVLGRSWFEESGDLIRLAVDFPLDVDLRDLNDRLETLDNISPSLLDQCTKPFLDGVSLEESDDLDEWLSFQRATVRNDTIELLESHLKKAPPDSGKLLPQLAHALQMIDPLNEAAVGFLLRYALNQNDQLKGLQTFDDYTARLATDLGLSPSPHLLQLKAMLENARLDNNRETTIEQPDLISGEIDYINSEGHYIAARFLDAGKPLTMLLVFGFVSHIERLFEEPGLRRFLLTITRYCNLVLFDKRGTGLSDRMGQPPTLQETTIDIQNIIYHYGLKQVVLAGASEGGLSAIHCAAHCPQHLHGLILYGTSAKWTAEGEYQYVISVEMYDRWLDFLEQNWGKPVNLQHFAPGTENDTALALWWAKTVRTASSPGMIRRILLAAKDADVRKDLARIKIPTLVMHKKGDRLLSVENGRYLAQQIKGAVFAELDGDKHWLWLDDTSQYFSALSGFVSELEVSGIDL